MFGNCQVCVKRTFLAVVKAMLLINNDVGFSICSVTLTH